MRGRHAQFSFLTLLLWLQVKSYLLLTTPIFIINWALIQSNLSCLDLMILSISTILIAFHVFINLINIQRNTCNCVIEIIILLRNLCKILTGILLMLIKQCINIFFNDTIISMAINNIISKQMLGCISLYSSGGSYRVCIPFLPVSLETNFDRAALISPLCHILKPLKFFYRNANHIIFSLISSCIIVVIIVFRTSLLPIIKNLFLTLLNCVWGFAN